MLELSPVVLASLLVALSVNAATSCPPTSSDIVSCSTDANGQDACCVPSPGGTFLFKQRFEPDKGDEGRWGIDGLDVLDCSSNSITPQKPTAPRAYSHEEIGSFCTTSPTFGAEYETWEAEWAESEVGEGLEEIWERAWRTGGRSISTLEPRCFDDYVVGEEVPLFFDSIHHLHQSLDPWRLLADSDITPSEGITYSRAEITNALTGKTGFEPYVSCVNETISTIFWPVHVKGKFQDSRFVSAKDVQVTHVESCPEEGIHYPSIPNVPRAAPSHTWDPITRPSPRSLSQEAIERSQNQGRRSDGDEEDAAPHAAHDKAVNVERLGFFKRADGKREEGKDQEDGWGQRKGTVRDEL